MNTRKRYITILNLICAASVVFLHTNGCFWTFSKGRYWFTANIIESVFYFAVPIFFMITGANLIDYQDRYSTKEFFKKRAKKVLIPFLAWSFIGLIFLLVTKRLSIHSIDIKYIFNGLCNGSIITIYWFFPALFGVYLCMPLFASVIKEKRIKVFNYIAFLGFILNCFIPFVINLFNLNVTISISMLVCNGAILYALIGYLLDKNDIALRNRILIYMLAVIGLLMHIIGTYKLSITSNSIVETFKGYYNLPCVLYSIGIFVFAKNILNKIDKPLFIEKFSKYSFPIYLVHIFVIDIIHGLLNLNEYSIFYRIGMPFVVIPISVFITFILKKIPIIKRIVP